LLQIVTHVTVFTKTGYTTSKSPLDLGHTHLTFMKERLKEKTPYYSTSQLSKYRVQWSPSMPTLKAQQYHSLNSVFFLEFQALEHWIFVPQKPMINEL